MLSTRISSHVAPAKARRASFNAAQPVHRQRSLHIARVDNVSQAVFDDQVVKASESGTPVLVDFWANWCGPCRLVAPLMDWVEKEYNGKVKVVKVEHDGNPELIAKYKVYGLPTLIVFKNGMEVVGSKREGAITKALLEKYLAQHGVSK